MRGNEFLDKMELVSGQYVEAADKKPKKKNVWVKWAALAACLCIIAGACAIFADFGGNKTDPLLGEIKLSQETTAKVSYGVKKGTVVLGKAELAWFNEEEMFAREEMYVFRGKVSGLTNITIDFNGDKEARCIALIDVERVYKGDIKEGEQIKMFLPCAITEDGVMVEDTGVITRIKVGMEGIFMPWVYDEESYWEQNGAKLMMEDLAPCGLADGERWAFLSTEKGLAFGRWAYPGAENAETLDDIEAYVIKMLG